MKKNTLFFCLLFVAACFVKPTHGQERQDELSLMISDAIPITLAFGLFDGLSESLRAAFGDYQKETEDKSMPGMISIGYGRKVNHWLAVGGDIGLTYFGSDITLVANDSRPNEYVDRKTSVFLVMPTGKFYYMQRNKVQLYGVLGAGLMIANKTESTNGMKEKESFSGFAFQVNPIGVRIGERIGGFAELGFGMKGIATLGISMRM